MASTLDEQAEEFYRVFSELARGYQLRDKDDTCRHGISVSQCYALDYVDAHEAVTMGELASALYLDLSTVTRAVDQLVQRRFVKRESDQSDRRICRIRGTTKGSRLIETIRSDMIARHRAILAELSPEARKGAIDTVSSLLEAFKAGNMACEDRTRKRNSSNVRAGV